MTFSRSHTGMIGIISLFTGMIAPVVGTGSFSYPFPLTDLQTITYLILFLLALGFYFVSIQNWKIFRIVGLILLIAIGYMFLATITGNVHAGPSGAETPEMRWGWLFIIIGAIAITYTSLNHEDTQRGHDALISDAIIGIVGTLTLIGLSALIIAASIDTRTQKNSKTILEKTFGSGNIETISGITMSQAYPELSELVFERKNDSISYIVPGVSGATVYPAGVFYTGTDIRFQNIGKKEVVTSSEGTWIDNIALDSRLSVELSSDSLIVGNTHSIDVIISEGTKSYSGTSAQRGTLRVAEGTNTIAWITKTLSGYEIQKEGKSISDRYPEISNLYISKSGYDTMALARTSSGETIVLKNGTPIETIREDYVENSWKSNGSHSIYVTNSNGVKRVIYDGVSIGKEFSEVREIFLEKSGNTYAFFAQPTGETTFCVFTRFRGNLCGLGGYMNPALGADGSSILYAGLKDGLWGIYRNTDAIIQDTGYTSKDISSDYVFFDITNPKQYVFVERQDTGDYQLRKSGKIIPGTWKDVGLDVTFGYDNKIIMTARDISGWRIIEL